MRKISLSLLPLILMVWVCPATVPNGYAGPHVSTAEPSTKGSLTAGYQEEYFHSKKVQFSGQNDFHGSSLFLNYAPFSSLELFLARKTLLNNNGKILPTLQSVSFTKSELGSKFLLPLSKKYFLGLETAYILLNGTGVPVFTGSSGRARLLNTAVLAPFKLHFNTEFFYSQAKKVLEGFDLSRFEHDELYGLSKRNTVNTGLSLEWATTYVSPYVEYSLDHALGSKVPPVFKNPNRLTLGMTIRPSISSPWRVELGSDYGFANKRVEGVALTPKWIVFAGLSFTSGSSAPQTVTEQTEEKTEEKVEEKSEAPKTSAYPIYPIGSDSPTEVSIQEIALPTSSDLETIKNSKWPIYPIKKSKKKMAVKKIKEAAPDTPKTIEAPRPVERSIPEIPITTQEQTPVGVEKPKEAPKEETSETKNIPSPKEFEKNYSEESENKDFLNHFR